MSEIVTPTDIENHLNSRDNFDLELSVYRHLRERGVPAVHGGSYADPQKGVVRQFDVRGTVIMNGETCAVSMAIECKSLSDTFPLVILRVPRDSTESYHQVLVTNIGNVNSTRVVEQRNPPSRYYRIGEYVGKHTSQIGVEVKKDGARVTNDSDRETYEKWSQAFASANGLIVEVFASPRHRQTAPSRGYIHYCDPGRI
jgi:hypothetical protein